MKKPDFLSLVCGTAIAHQPHDLAIGWLRYEVLRTLNPKQFSDLYRRSLLGEKPFDYLVDDMVAERFVT